MKTLRWIKGLGFFCLVALVATFAQAEPVRIFAAASLQGPLEAVATGFDQDTVISYAGSGAIARQISQGAPADAVILANTAWAEWLQTQGIIAETRPILSNTLVLIGHADAAPLPNVSPQTLVARLGDRRLAMGQHQSVPAGIYAQAWLDQIGAWEVLQPKLAETENVRAALTLVARQETSLGIVYASDAAASTLVEVLYAIPPDQHPKILYPALSLTSSGAAFLDHLTADRAAFTAAGFRLP